MVCIPCFAAPVLLFIWYKFLYPLLRPLLERWFGDRFAEPADPDYCPICPLNSKGKCEAPGQAGAEGGDEAGAGSAGDADRATAGKTEALLAGDAKPGSKKDD